VIARGRVIGADRGVIKIRIPGVSVGDIVRVGADGEVVARVDQLHGSHATAVPSQSCIGIALGAPVRIECTGDALALGMCALGIALDASGTALHGRRPVGPRVALRVRPCLPHERASIAQPFWTGVRAIDGLLTFGRGARIGIFGAPGCGKSSLIERILAGSDADAVVVALIGERGREARHWIDSMNSRTTMVCATSDRSAIERVRAAGVAAAQAFALRRRGLHVVVLLDSLARFAAALREIAVAAGEPAGRGGFPASVFAELARLVEIAGNFHDGSITLIASVLDDGDERDPISDAARSLLDGHIALSTRLAAEGRFPAIDVLNSASRTMTTVVTPQQLRDGATLRRALSVLERTEDARSLGIAAGNETARAAVAAHERIEAFLYDDAVVRAPQATLEELHELAAVL
jgi:ATP synthase in type III secretion protein N